jgi:Flp pilus assembly protein TadB
VRGPPITIQCECGEVGRVPYGERWQCERCGRRWNTAQIPAEEYWGLMRAMRRYRLSVIGVALGLTLAFGLLALFVSSSLFLVLPVVLAAWFLWYMPLWRRKVRRHARSAPKWELHPE